VRPNEECEEIMSEELTVDTEVATPIDADLVRALEAIILVATDPVPVDLLAQILGHREAVVESLCASLAAAYEEAGHGFQLVRVAGGFRYQSHPDVAVYVERFILDGQKARLSGAALETLAIVAYKQPISRAQIASIRGVDPDGVLRTLQGRGYIDQVGRDPGPGQAVMWGTTPAFLEKLGINSVNDLPPIVEFIPGADIVEALEVGLRISKNDDLDVSTPEPVSVPVEAEHDESGT
jgi:segregation and condensation protein B